MTAPTFARACRLIEPAGDLTPEQRDRLLLILRDRLGVTFWRIAHVLGCSRKVAEARYLRLHGTSKWRIECARDLGVESYALRRPDLSPQFRMRV